LEEFAEVREDLAEGVYEGGADVRFADRIVSFDNNCLEIRANYL